MTDTAVDLGGWTLRTETLLSADRLLRVASGKIDLADEQVPLNQNGDNISLLNSPGNGVDSVEYPSGQVSGVPENSAPKR